MPRVTRKDGIFSRVTKKPLKSPIPTAVSIAIRNESSSEAAPLLKSVHISTGANPKSEPTERSNSPAVIRSVIASAISPSSTVKVSVFEILSGERNDGLIHQKTTSSSTSSTSGPNSGMATKRWRNVRCGKGVVLRKDGRNRTGPVPPETRRYLPDRMSS